MPLVVDITGADRGATVTASAGGVPWATFHWPEDDGADLVLGQVSSTWTFLLTVSEDDDAKYRDQIEQSFWVSWSNPNPLAIEVCDATTCAPADAWGGLVAPVTLRPAGPLDDAVETTWFISDLPPVTGDADGGAPWTWDPGPAESYDVRVHVARDGAPDSFGFAHVVVSAS